MGYSGRYHAASLAAVFLALAIGILIGVGLGHKVVSGTTKNLEQSLKSDLASARGRADDLQGQLNRQNEFEQQVYPTLAGRVLRGERIAVVALGGAARRHQGGRRRRWSARQPHRRGARGGRGRARAAGPAAISAAAPKGSRGREVARDPQRP